MLSQDRVRLLACIKAVIIILVLAVTIGCGMTSRSTVPVADKNSDQGTASSATPGAAPIDVKAPGVAGSEVKPQAEAEGKLSTEKSTTVATDTLGNTATEKRKDMGAMPMNEVSGGKKTEMSETVAKAPVPPPGPARERQKPDASAGTDKSRVIAPKPLAAGQDSRQHVAVVPTQGQPTPQQVPPEEMDDNTFFQHYGVNPFIETSKDHFSTFAVDVDKASYTMARNYLKQLNVPPPGAVRVEEFVNFFNYHYAAPTQQAFAIYLEGAPSKFGDDCQMLRIGLQSKALAENSRKKANLVFIIDTSGSMNRGGRMGLMKESLKLLVNNLRQGDRIGIVAYNTTARLVLAPTGVESKQKIISAIDTLYPGGSTNIEEGLRQGYDMASNHFLADATNRVILCSDGVANTGRTSVDDLLNLVARYKDDGIFLTAVGVGMGNYNDVLLEKLGDRGSGHYEYIDDIKEAERIFKHELLGTLQVVAKDTKIQVDFNPEVVRSFRQLGYENRAMAHQEFRNDRKEGGQVGSGHSVTALYEIKLKPGKQGKVATVFIRYKDPDSDRVTELKKAITVADFKKNFAQASDSFKLASASAEFAEILRDSYWAKNGSLARVKPVLDQLSSNMKSDTRVRELAGLVDAARVAYQKHGDQAKAGR